MGEERDIVERLQAEVDDLRKAIRNQAETWTRGFKEAGKMPPASLRKVAAEAELSALRSRIVEVGGPFAALLGNGSKDIWDEDPDHWKAASQSFGKRITIGMVRALSALVKDAGGEG